MEEDGAGGGAPPSRKDQLSRTASERDGGGGGQAHTDADDVGGARSGADRDAPWWVSVKNSDLPPEFWEEKRRVRNLRRKERAKKNKHERLEGEKQRALAGGLTEEELVRQDYEASKGRVAAHLAQEAKVAEAARGEGLRLAVECAAFAGDMSQKEARSLAKQLCYVKHANAKSERPAALNFCGYRGTVKELADGMGAGKWEHVAFHEGHVDEAFPRGQVCLLSPDAEEVLDPTADLDQGTVYCVGGLVDRVVIKGRSRGWGESRQIRTARLPLHEVLPGISKAGCVLNVNTVVEVLLRVWASGAGAGGWEEALRACLPANAVNRSAREPKRKRRAGAGSDGGGSGGGAGGGEVAGEEDAGQGSGGGGGGEGGGGDKGGSENTEADVGE